jgi:vacuolar-type H+-ATPase subunit C/Vma6
VGFPIRRSLDQSSFAAPQGISQRTTSFIASQRQGIHQMLLRHLITLMIDVRSAKSRTRSSKKDLSSAFAKDMFLLAKHIRRERLRAVAGSQDLGVPLAEYAASLRFQTSALTLTGEDRESHDKIHDHEVSWP